MSNKNKCFIERSLVICDNGFDRPATIAELLGVKQLDANVDRDRAALIHAKHFLDLPERDLHQAIAYLLATNQERDLDKAALKARLHSLES